MEVPLRVVDQVEHPIVYNQWPCVSIVDSQGPLIDKAWPGPTEQSKSHIQTVV